MNEQYVVFQIAVSYAIKIFVQTYNYLTNLITFSFVMHGYIC
jgi:hypothetical protein